MAYRNLGTGSGHAADGAHTHAGTYASTSHAATHAGGGSDPITSLGDFTLTGSIVGNNDRASLPSMTDETSVYFGGFLRGYTPFLYTSTRNEVVNLVDGDPFFGPIKWVVYPLASSFGTAFGSAGASLGGSIAAQAATTALPRRGQCTNTAGANSKAGFESSDTFITGSGINGGWTIQFLINFPSAASAYTNSGASTGTRFFFGVTDQTAANSVGSDNPSGNRFGFSWCNVNGGLTNTNIFLTEKDGTTETRLDSGIALAQNKLLRMTIHSAPGWPYMGYELENLTDGTSYGNTFEGSNTPSSTAMLRIVAGMNNVNSTGTKSFEIVRIGAKISFG